METNNNPWPFTSETNIEMTKPHLSVIAARKELLATLEQDRQMLLSDAKRNGVNVVHVFDESDPKGGLTIAFRKAQPTQTSTNMVDVAVATCSYADNFSRKIGTQLALQKWFDGDLVSLPMSTGHADEDLNGIVKRKFHSFFFTE